MTQRRPLSYRGVFAMRPRPYQCASGGAHPVWCDATIVAGPHHWSAPKRYGLMEGRPRASLRDARGALRKKSADDQPEEHATVLYLQTRPKG